MIIVFADLFSPLILNRINLLNKLNEKILLVHNADGLDLNSDILKKYNNFKIIEQPKIKNKNIRYIASMFFTLYLILKYKPKLIVIHWASRLYQNIIFYFFAKKIIVSTMGGDINSEEEANGIKYIFTNLLLKNCKIITVKSNYMKEIIIKNFPQVKEDKIKIISWGVEDRFNNSEKDKQLLNQLGIKSDIKVYFCIRRMARLYHKQEILNAFFRYKQKTNSNDILIVSIFDYKKDIKYFEEYKNILENSKFKDSVILINIPHLTMHNYLSIADIVLSYTHTDGLSQSIMESVLAKKFCITYNTKHHKELIKHKKNGYFFNNEDELLLGMMYKYDKSDLEVYNEILDKNIQEEKYLMLCNSILLKD